LKALRPYFWSRCLCWGFGRLFLSFWRVTYAVAGLCRHWGKSFISAAWCHTAACCHMKEEFGCFCEAYLFSYFCRWF
jgi:hypothetical protein